MLPDCWVLLYIVSYLVEILLTNTAGALCVLSDSANSVI